MQPTHTISTKENLGLDMFINTGYKKLNNVAISATFEHDGIPYESRFGSKGQFKKAIQRTKDRFINAVDYVSFEVITKDNIKEYIATK